ncbi:MAG TPA: hypothetical protein VF266_24770 [Thermoanaerobaculia bacterium]
MRLFLAVLLALLAAPHTLHACTCLVSEPKSEFKSATAVFAGEVLESADGVVRLRVLERFKGAQSQVVEVQNNVSTCEYGGLTPGSQHLIYAHEHLGSLTVSICTRSRPLERAECDLGYLRSRAAWWRSPLSSLRLAAWLGIRRAACRNS